MRMKEAPKLAKFIDPWLGDKVNSGIGLSYRAASPAHLVCRSWLYLPSQGLWIRPQKGSANNQLTTLEGLDGWPNTAADLASWRRATRRVWFCTWWMVHAACPDGSNHLPRFWGWSVTKCTQNIVMIYVTQGRHGLVLLDKCLLSVVWSRGGLFSNIPEPPKVSLHKTCPNH